MTDYKADNILEKIASLIPGYAGYADRESRRDTDKLLRRELCARLDDSKRAFDGAGVAATKAGDLDLAGRVEEVRRRMGIATDAIRHASYGAGGFFDVVQVMAEDLDKLYRFDLALRDEVETVVREVGALRGAEDAGAALDVLDEHVRRLREALDRRDNVITEIK